MVWEVLGVEETWIGEEGEESNIDVVRSDAGLSLYSRYFKSTIFD